MIQPHLTISLLGEFSLLVDGKPAVGFNGDRPITLLTYLLLHRHSPQSRQQLAFTLWPDSTDGQARANLRNLFYTLRHTLPAADSFLLADAMTIQWRTDTPYTLDVAAFETALMAAQAAVSLTDKRKQLETAVTLYKGELLPGNYDDWIIPLREEYHQAYLDALHQLLALYQQEQAFRAATRIGQRLLQLDPLDETIYVQLMRLHALSGDRAGVRRLYAQCVATLNRELDIDPSPTTLAAYEQYLRLEAPSGSLPEPDTNSSLPIITTARPLALPIPATSFVGRELELAHLAQLLADPTCRLLTIVGPGGIGKTRLALQTAMGHQPVFADGVVWVSLNPLSTADQLVAALAEALQHRLTGRLDPETELLQLLAAKELLLVFDNFEHLLPATHFLTRLISETTEIKVLVTSRQVLNLQEEWRFELGELPLPEEQDIDSLADNSAVQLFIQSARRASNTIALTEDDYPAVAHICHLVGGVPLGIELAASWTRLLSCLEIAQEIEKSLDFLTVTVQNMPPRHRSLRAVFDYSWNLLTAEEQLLLARLAIFKGGFTREAAAQVAGAELHALSLFVDRSLVQRTAVGRYSLHNIIRQYASQQLQANQDHQRETAQKHSRYYLEWCLSQESVLRSVQQKEAVAAIAVDSANIRAAWAWSITSRAYALLRKAVFCLFLFYELRGLIQAGELFLRSSAERLQQESDPDDQVAQITIYAIYTYQAFFAHRLGQSAAAELKLGETVKQLQAFKEDGILIGTFRNLGSVVWASGNFTEALTHIHSSLELATRHQMYWDIANNQTYLGNIRYDQGELEMAYYHFEIALPLAKQVGDPRLIAHTLYSLARTNLALGHIDKAEQQLNESMMLARHTNDHFSLANSSLYQGLVLAEQADLFGARELIQHSIDLFSQTNDRWGMQRAFVLMGFLEITAGNYPLARSYFLPLLEAKERILPIKYVLSAVIGLATLQAYGGDLVTALRWTIVVLQHPALDWETQKRAKAFCDELENQSTTADKALAQAEAGEQCFEQLLLEVVHRSAACQAHKVTAPNAIRA